MVAEVLYCLRPVPGDLVVDCTLGGGGHAQAILERIAPGGRVIGLDVDGIELPHTEARLRAAGHGPATFIARRANFARLREVFDSEGLAHADAVLVDLGVSTMQHDTPDRGFSYKCAGPLDMRMDTSRGETAADLLGRCDAPTLAHLLVENADEPHAGLIADILTRQRIVTTHALERFVRVGLSSAQPSLTKSDIKMSVRRTFQALRIAVNDEFGALDALLSALPHCLAPGGRVAVITFHSGEDRRVKKAFQGGRRAGAYAAIAEKVIRSTKDETFSNRRAAAAKLRWAVRSE